MVSAKMSTRGERFCILVADEVRKVYDARRAMSVARGQEITQEILAKKVGVGRTAIIHYLHGKRQFPLAVLIETCEVLDADPHEVIRAAYSLLVAELGPPE